VSIFVPIPLSFVDQSSPRRLGNFGDDIPTSPEVIEAHTLNFKPNFKFLRLKFFGGPPSPLGDGLGSLGQSVTSVKFERAAPRNGRNVASRKMSIWVGHYEQLELFCLWTKVHQLSFAERARGSN